MPSRRSNVRPTSALTVTRTGTACQTAGQSSRMAAHLRPPLMASACPTPRKSAPSACDAAITSSAQPVTRAASAALSSS